MEEGRYYGANIRTTDDDGRDPDRKPESRSGFLWSDPPETVGVKKLSDVHCLRASCGDGGATVSPRDSGRKARSREEKKEIGAGKCSVSTARSTGLRHQQLREE